MPRFAGDAMMIHAATAPLRAAGAPVIAWGPAWVVDLFKGAEGYAAVVEDAERKYSPYRAAALLRKHRPASLINFPKSNRPMLAGLLARVPLRLGCGDGGAWLFYTHSVRFYAQDTPFVERYASILRQAFPDLGDPPFRPYRPRPELMAEAERRHRSSGLGDYLVLVPGGNSHSKRPAVPALVRLGRWAAGAGLGTVLLGGPGDDQELARAIRAELPDALDLTGGMGLAESAAWVARATALVGGDTAATHIAGACGIPTLAVFGPTRPRHSLPAGPRVRGFRYEGLECLECMGFTCPVAGHPCMGAADPGPMQAALEHLLQR
jgi:ADP-heptose:LPS heptosyltransferase